MDSKLLRFDKNKTLVFLDFETLNLCLNFCHNLPWQMGILKCKGENVIEAKNILIKWDTELRISQGAAEITGYNHDEVLRKGISPDLAFDIMYKFLNEADFIVGHNILGFDIYMIKEWCLLKNKPYKQFIPKIIDTFAIAKGLGLGAVYKKEDNFMEYQYKMINQIKKGLKTKLIDVGKQNNIEHNYENLHNALEDLKLNFKVWNILKYKIEI